MIKTVLQITQEEVKRLEEEIVELKKEIERDE